MSALIKVLIILTASIALFFGLSVMYGFITGWESTLPDWWPIVGFVIGFVMSVLIFKRERQ